MSKPFSDPIVDRWVEKFSLITGIVFTIAAIFASYYSTAIVMVTVFGAGSFLTLTGISYFTRIRIEAHEKKRKKEEANRKKSIDEQLVDQMKRMEETLGIDSRSLLRKEVEKIETERKSLTSGTKGSK